MCTQPQQCPSGHGSAPGPLLTKERLLKALADIQREGRNLEALLQMEAYKGIPPGSGQEAAERSAEELYSDELLDHLNRAMAPLYAAFCTSISDSGKGLMPYSGQSAYGVRTLDTVYDKPAARVGTRFLSSGRDACGLVAYSQVCTYIDIDGNIFSVLERVLSGKGGRTVIGSRALLGSPQMLSLCTVQEHLPGAYKGFWDG